VIVDQKKEENDSCKSQEEEKKKEPFTPAKEESFQNGVETFRPESDRAHSLVA